MSNAQQSMRELREVINDAIKIAEDDLTYNQIEEVLVQFLDSGTIVKGNRILVQGD